MCFVLCIGKEDPEHRTHSKKVEKQKACMPEAGTQEHRENKKTKLRTNWNDRRNTKRLKQNIIRSRIQHMTQGNKMQTDRKHGLNMLGKG